MWLLLEKTSKGYMISLYYFLQMYANLHFSQSKNLNTTYDMNVRYNYFVFNIIFRRCSLHSTHYLSGNF